jgi:hypothetical protein
MEMILVGYRTVPALVRQFSSITSETRRERQIAQIYSIAYIRYIALTDLLGKRGLNVSGNRHLDLIITHKTRRIVAEIPKVEQRSTFSIQIARVHQIIRRRIACV